MYNSYFLRYRIRLDGRDEFLTMEVSGHYRNVMQARRENEDFCPVILQNKDAQKRVRFKLLEVKINEFGPYYDV